MDHIEFIGPPGAGKSTLHSYLVKQEDWFGGINDGAIDRLVEDDHFAYQLLYRIAFGRLKSTVKMELLHHRYHRNAFKRYVTKNVGVLDIIPEIIRSATQAPEEAVLFYKKTIENYQLAIESKFPQEIFCWDEGFAMAAVAILWRSDELNFPLKQYFDCLPIPSTIVYVDAPKEVCLQRADNREQKTLTKDWIDSPQSAYDKHQRACKHVIKELPDSVNIIHIKNTGTVEAALEKFHTKWDKPPDRH